MSQIRVDFYLLSSSSLDDKWLLVCKLLEKAYKRGHRVFVYCDSQEQAEHIDELLWTYKEDSFVPHHLQGEGPEPPPPVQIGYGEEPRGFNDILMNVSSTIPAYFSRFRRIMEVVVNDEVAKEVSRNHYRDYRAKKCDLHTHDLM